MLWIIFIIKFHEVELSKCLIWHGNQLVKIHIFLSSGCGVSLYASRKLQVVRFKFKTQVHGMEPKSICEGIPLNSFERHLSFFPSRPAPLLTNPFEACPFSLSFKIVPYSVSYSFRPRTWFKIASDIYIWLYIYIWFLL